MPSQADPLFNPLPYWIQDIKAEARRRISSANFAAACRHGNSAVMRGLIVGLWPFVDEFPKSIIRGALRLPTIRLLKDRQLLNTLLHRGPEILCGIQRDERNHRKLWLQTGQALGLNYPLDFERPVLPQTKAWIDSINSETDASTLFLHFAAVEIIAEAISVDLLSSKTFVGVLGERGCEWFRVHAEHEPGMSHEELELHLAFAFVEGYPNKEETGAVIQRSVDLFVTAAETSARFVPLRRSESPGLRPVWPLGKTNKPKKGKGPKKAHHQS